MGRAASIWLGRLAAVLIVLSALPIVWLWHTAPVGSGGPAGGPSIRADQLLIELRGDDGECDRARAMRGTRIVAGYDFGSSAAHTTGDNGHGTHVAGTTAATTNNEEGVAGLAPEAKIMPLNVLSRAAFGSAGNIGDAI